MEAENKEKNDEIKSQSLSAAAGFIFWNALASIIGYISIVIFKPIIDCILKWIKIKGDENEKY
jgi:hypothetical protein